MSDVIKVNRRDFLKTGAVLGGGLILGMHISGLDSALAAASKPAVFVPNAFIRIAHDGTVTFIINHSELGQGTSTALAMLIAEELECDWKRVRLEFAPVDPVYNNPAFGAQGTGGSTGTWTEFDRLRIMGASAREMLMAAAAKGWQVDPDDCRAENGRVIHKGGRSIDYGKLVDRAAKMPVPKEVKVKEPKDWKMIGKPVHRLDSPAKIEGTAEFGLDVKLPGILTVLVAHPPVFGGKVKSFNVVKAKAVHGVKAVVQVPSGIAVAATGFWAAKKGRDALDIEWAEGPGARLDTHEILKNYAEMAAKPGLVARRDGEPDGAYARAAQKLNAEYSVPYLAHATMEPLNCTVDLRKDGCEIWTGTQSQTADRNAAARVLGLKPEQVKLHTTLAGCGFGRRASSVSDFVVTATEVAKVLKKPVKVVWTREDDMRAGFYRPLCYDRISAGLDESGRLTAWRHTIVAQSICAGTPYEAFMVKDGIDSTSVEGAADIPYSIPNILVDLHSPSFEVPVNWWRSVGHSHNAFVVEGFLDEVAHAAGKDPFEFRRALLADKPRHRGVLEMAAEKAGWGKPLPAGVGRGVAVHESYGSFTASVVEASVDNKGKIRVHRVVTAVDCGMHVNPDCIAAQMESAAVFAISAALYGEITLKNGRVEQGNYDSYPILRIGDMPRVETHIVPSREKPGGIGEPGVPVVAPALANAIFAATGIRVRSLPIRADAMKKV
jgi:isoquinoline 1-oxidoreductase beta subunit